MNDTLEQLIDTNGLSVVLNTLADICNLKAQHIEEAWQDRELARAWIRAALAIGTVSNKVIRAGLK